MGNASLISPRRTPMMSLSIAFDATTTGLAWNPAARSGARPGTADASSRSRPRHGVLHLNVMLDTNEFVFQPFLLVTLLPEMEKLSKCTPLKFTVPDLP